MTKRKGGEFSKYILPIVDVLKSIGGSGTSSEVTDAVIDKLSISEEEPIVRMVNLQGNKMDITDTLPIIKNCHLAVCNDSSFSHISAALGIKTLVLMTDTPLLYGSYSSLMTAILPELAPCFIGILSRTT